MIINKLKETQTIIYEILEQSFKLNKVPHSFLLKGNDTKLKKETAFFIAKSIVENKLACESCNTCRRIDELVYTDLIYIDGTKETIKKEEIEKLQNRFSLMANEQAQKKVYIINCIENTSDASLNSLLKFLEEPSGEDTYAILITNSVDSVLPTIVSRCMVLNFRNTDYHLIFDEYKQARIDEVLSYYLAKTAFSFNEEYLEDEVIQSSYYFFKQFIKCYPDQLDKFLYDIHSELLLYKDKNIEIETLRWLMDFIVVFIKEMVLPFNLSEDWYNIEVNRIKSLRIDYALVMQQVTETKALINKTYDYRLMIDRLIYLMKESSYGK